MGQCQYCRKSANMKSAENKENIAKKSSKSSSRQSVSGSSDSALESSHSDDDNPEIQRDFKSEFDAKGKRCYSSESSGKYSLKDSSGSCLDYDHNFRFKSQTDTISEVVELDETMFSGSFSECEEVFASTQDIQITPKESSLRKLKTRKVSWGSNDSDTFSLSSNQSNSVAILRARIKRSISLREQRQFSQSEMTHNLESSMKGSRKQTCARRTVSLRLPKSQRKGYDFDTKLHTIYVDDSPRCSKSYNGSGKRRNSLQQALSLLSLNSLKKETASTSSDPRPQKQVQRILRQPTKRHRTVRGISGLAIDNANQCMPRYTQFQQSSTLYYPTTTSIRRSQDRRSIYS